MPLGSTGKTDSKNIVLAQMITPEIVTDVFRANGAIILFNKLGVIDNDLLGRFEECFDDLRTQLVQGKGIVTSVTR